MPVATCCVTPDNPAVDNTVLANAASVDTCTVYEAAFATLPQASDKVRDVFSVPDAGVLRFTATGTFGIVVKLQTSDHDPGPAKFVALTRQ
jgi:hypothetical protein